MQQRIEEVKHAKDIIEEELQLLNAEYKRQKADKIISDLYKKVERIKEAECREAINKLSAYHTIGEIEKKVIYDLTRSFSNQILAEPTKVLRSAAEDDDDAFLNTAALLFNLNGKEEKKRK
ncbi:MAG: Glutamyl-tRNA reductase [Candidatus Methanoperedenaceae archaeon GB50]|nr:MAG: Glutamyl-tRNA reductase [Candidatus Methanoperedenaceae archaeon GB50]